MWSIILPSIVVPLVFLSVWLIIEMTSGKEEFWGKMVVIGRDLCILGMGVAGGIFASPEMERLYGSGSASVYAALIVEAVDLGLAALVLYLRRRDNVGRFEGTLAIILGVLAVGIPAGLTFQRVAALVKGP